MKLQQYDGHVIVPRGRLCKDCNGIVLPPICNGVGVTFFFTQ